MKRRVVNPRVLGWLPLLLAAGFLQAEQTSPASASDAIFLWLAGGLSSARIQRLATLQPSQARDETATLSCHATLQCTRSLQKAGADSPLIQSLARKNSERNSDRSTSQQPIRQRLCLLQSGGSNRGSRL